VILETRALVMDLFKRFPHLKDECDHFMERVMECLAFEKAAQDQLSLMCAELVDDVLQMSSPDFSDASYLSRLDPETKRQQYLDTVVAGANQMHKFGTELHGMLRQLSLYRDGYLHYEFAGLVGHDMLMERLMVPVLSTRIPIDYLTDDDLWVRSASRRNRRR
jgi:hypothetical protein